MIDMTSQRFGKWLVLGRAISGKRGNDRWLCRCACGKEKIVYGGGLRRNRSRQCSSCAKTIHGFGKTRLYKTWICIIDRCKNPNHPQYKEYGGRRIKVCPEWQKDFMVFRAWALENGYGNNLTIDRIDNERGYSPENCRFATAKQQQRNRRDNVYLKIGSEVKLLVEWAEQTGIKYQVLWQRIKRGYPENRILEPVRG